MAIEEEQIRGRIREARLEAGLTQAQLADLAHVHLRTIENWENVSVPWKSINDIARLTGKSSEWLLHGDALTPGESAAIRSELAGIRELLDEVLRRLDR